MLLIPLPHFYRAQPWFFRRRVHCQVKNDVHWNWFWSHSSLSSFLLFLFYFSTSLNAAYPDRQRLNKDLIKRGYDIAHNRYPEGYQEAPLAYDAVWSVALAFNKTMERLKVKSRSLKDFTYTDKDIADEIYAAMNSTQFLGVSVSERDCLFSIKITINFRFLLKPSMAAPPFYHGTP